MIGPEGDVGGREGVQKSLTCSVFAPGVGQSGGLACPDDVTENMCAGQQEKLALAPHLALEIIVLELQT
jgi:hypothetical protein